jgi:hypothetical protein
VGRGLRTGRASRKDPGDIGQGRIRARERLVRLELQILGERQGGGDVRIAQGAVEFERLRFRLLLRQRIGHTECISRQKARQIHENAAVRALGKNFGGPNRRPGEGVTHRGFLRAASLLCAKARVLQLSEYFFAGPPKSDHLRSGGLRAIEAQERRAEPGA